MSETRKILNAFMKQQVEELGARRRDIALVLFARGYTERQVGLIMDINPKSAHAMKVDFSKKGKEAREKKGKLVYIKPETANLKRVNGQKVLTKFIALVDKVLAESETVKEM